MPKKVERAMGLEPTTTCLGSISALATCLPSYGWGHVPVAGWDDHTSKGKQKVAVPRLALVRISRRLS